MARKRRKDILESTLKRRFALSGNRCAFRDCEPHAKEEELQRLAWADWPGCGEHLSSGP